MNRQARRHPERHPTTAVIAWIHPGAVAGEFCQSVALTLLRDGAAHRRIAGFLSLASSPRISYARTRIVDDFLAFAGDPEWLFMVDADMAFDADTLDRLLDVADPEDRPIVGGLCFVGGREQPPHPTLYRLVDDDGAARLQPILDWPHGELVQVDATGAACLLVHRTVFEQLQLRYPRPFPWFAETFLDKAQIGEDVTFCLRARRLGIPVHVHTGVEVGHMKTARIDSAYFDLYQTLTEEKP